MDSPSSNDSKVRLNVLLKKPASAGFFMAAGFIADRFRSYERPNSVGGDPVPEDSFAGTRHTNNRHKKTRRCGFFLTPGSLLLESTKTLLELVDTTAGIQNFLLTSVEWVTSRAYIQSHSARLSGFSVDHVTARAGSDQFCVFWLNIVLHNKPLNLRAATNRTSVSTALLIAKLK